MLFKSKRPHAIWMNINSITNVRPFSIWDNFLFERRAALWEWYINLKTVYACLFLIARTIHLSFDYPESDTRLSFGLEFINQFHSPFHPQMFRISKNNVEWALADFRQFTALPLPIGCQSNVKRRCFEMHRQRHTWNAQESRNRVQGIKLFSCVVQIDCVRRGARFFFFNFFASPKQIFLSLSSKCFRRPRNE